MWSPSIVDAKHTPTLRYHSRNISSYSSAVFSACLVGLEQFKCSTANHVTPHRYTIHSTGFDLVRVGICTTPPSHITLLADKHQCFTKLQRPLYLPLFRPHWHNLVRKSIDLTRTLCSQTKDHQVFTNL